MQNKCPDTFEALKVPLRRVSQKMSCFWICYGMTFQIFCGSLTRFLLIGVWRHWHQDCVGSSFLVSMWDSCRCQQRKFCKKKVTFDTIFWIISSSKLPQNPYSSIIFHFNNRVMAAIVRFSTLQFQLLLPLPLVSASSLRNRCKNLCRFQNLTGRYLVELLICKQR